MQKLTKTLFALAGLMSTDQSSFITQVRADQPVHCLRGQVYGMWHFYTTE